MGFCSRHITGGRRTVRSTGENKPNHRSVVICGKSNEAGSESFVYFDALLFRLSLKQISLALVQQRGARLLVRNQSCIGG